MYQFALFLVRNQTLAEDITSEVFIRFINKFSEIASGKEKSWLLSTTRFVSFEYGREKQKHKILDFSEVEEQSQSKFKSTEQKVEEDSLKDKLNDDLQKLPKETSEIIILKTWHDLSFKRIAAIVKKEENALKQRYYRGLDTLKTQNQLTLNSQAAGGVAVLLGALKVSSFYSFSAAQEYALLQNILSVTHITMTTSGIAGFLSTTIGKISILALFGITTGSLALGGAYVISEDSPAPEESSQERGPVQSMSCSFSGRTILDGENATADDDCSLCTCSNGVVICDSSLCPVEESSTSTESQVLAFEVNSDSFNYSFKYNEILGNSSINSFSEPNLNCEAEIVTFERNLFEFTFGSGFAECFGAGGGRVVNEKSATALSGQTFDSITFLNEFTGYNTILVEYQMQSEGQVQIARLYSRELFPEEVMEAQFYMNEVVESLEFEF